MTALMALTAGRDAVSLYPERRPVSRPASVWLEIAAQLAHHGDGGLATAIQQAMNGRRLSDNARVPLTTDEQRRVDAALQDWLGEQEPD